MERRKPSGKPENIDRRIEGDTFPEGCKSKSSLKKFRLKALKKEGSSRHRLRAKYAKKSTEIRLRLNAPDLGTVVRLAESARPRRTPEPRRLAGARVFQGRPRPEAPRTLAPGIRQPRRKRHPSSPKARSHPAPASERPIRRAFGRKAASARVD